MFVTRISLIQLIFTILFLTSIQIFSQQNQFFRTEGKEIVDPSGKPVLLRGINLGNWLNPEGYMFLFEKTSSAMRIDEMFRELVGPEETDKLWETFRKNYITEKDIRFIKQCGLNSIRVPFNFRLFMKEQYPPVWEGPGFEMLDSVVTWSERNELLVILDLHAAPGGQTGDNIDDSRGYPFLFESNDMQLLTIYLWQRIAERYKNSKTVIGYDLLNEPIAHFHDVEKLNPLLEPLYKRIIHAIREVDPYHMIFIGGAQWNTNFQIFNESIDYEAVYTFHTYWTPTDVSVIQRHIDFRDKFNVPIWCGETGENTNEWISAFRETMETNNIGWCFWPYKKLDSDRGVVSIPKPEGWDDIIKFAEGDRTGFDKIRNARLDQQKAMQIMNEFLKNCLLENNNINKGYLEALGLSLQK
ncbi:MAG: cellulase family glycosylhydrolase [bacterium]